MLQVLGEDVTLAIPAAFPSLIAVVIWALVARGSVAVVIADESPVCVAIP
jgi:hypothetical protein